MSHVDCTGTVPMRFCWLPQAHRCERKVLPTLLEADSWWTVKPIVVVMSIQQLVNVFVFDFVQIRRFVRCQSEL